MSVPAWFVCGESETWLVWMSAGSTPAFLTADATAVAAAAFWASAALAVVARVSTVKSNPAWSGTVVTEPLPVTVIVFVVVVVAAWQRRGWAIPAIAEATRRTPARRRMERSRIMWLIRRRSTESSHARRVRRWRSGG